MRPTRRALVIAAAITVISVSAASAYSVQPMIYALTPSGAGSTVRLTINNSRQGLLNVELEPYAVTADDAGKRQFTPAPNDFLIFPPQASIPGDKVQLFQVRYVGSPTLTQGRAYVLRVRQTNTTEAVKPDPNSKTQTSLALAINFNTTAIVQPKDMLPNVTIEGEPTPSAAGLTARIVNHGKGVADLTQLAWSVDQGGKTTPMNIDTVKYGDAIFLEPGHARDITLTKVQGPARLTVSQAGVTDGTRRR